MVNKHKKDFVLLLVLLLGMAGAIFGIYWPMLNKVQRLQQELATVQAQIAQTQRLVNQDVSLQKGIQTLKVREQELHAKFPAKEEQTLQRLIGTARNMGLQVTSVTAQPKRPCENTGSKTKSDGRVCQSVLVDFKMLGTFPDLYRYMQTIKNDFEAVLMIENLKIDQHDPDTPEVNIGINVNVYLLT